ncbi:MAG: hypothetical protein D6753_09330 [Planctomycetota bacterium]|nr:MAG: hypothetical protein D6753_09330 [Planctomycetota bacterium]
MGRECRQSRWSKTNHQLDSHEDSAMNQSESFDAIALLAQADLVLITVDLLRPPSLHQQPFASMGKADMVALCAAAQLPASDALADRLWCAVELAQTAEPSMWDGCWRLLFDASLYCPINESAYIRRDKGAIIGDVCGFYRAFGWQSAANGERPDHLLTELEFVAMLLVMSARATSQDQLDITRQALERFTRDHLNDWIDAFAAKLQQTTTFPVLEATARWLPDLWHAMAECHGWVLDPNPPLRSVPGQEPEEAYECGAPDVVALSAGQRSSSKTSP